MSPRRLQQHHTRELPAKALIVELTGRSSQKGAAAFFVCALQNMQAIAASPKEPAAWKNSFIKGEVKNEKKHRMGRGRTTQV